MAERVLVTGSASGLGRAVAARFSKAGHQVLVSDVDEARASAAAEEIGARAIRLDVTDDDDWAAARDWCAREWGGLDVLVNNAGVAAGGRFEKIGMADWDWIWDINVKGVVQGCRTFVPDFKAAGRGHLVNVASLAGIMNLPAMSSYNVTKAAVISLSETLRLELEPYGVRTTVVCPGFVKTNLNDTLRSPDPAIATLMNKLMASSTVTADDVAEQVFDAVARGRFLVLTHKEGRRSALLKRLGLTDRQVRKYWARLRKAVDKGDEKERGESRDGAARRDGTAERGGVAGSNGVEQGAGEGRVSERRVVMGKVGGGEEGVVPGRHAVVGEGAAGQGGVAERDAMTGRGVVAGRGAVEGDGVSGGVGERGVDEGRDAVVGRGVAVGRDAVEGDGLAGLGGVGEPGADEGPDAAVGRDVVAERGVVAGRRDAVEGDGLAGLGGAGVRDAEGGRDVGASRGPVDERGSVGEPGAVGRPDAVEKDGELGLGGVGERVVDEGRDGVVGRREVAGRGLVVGPDGVGERDVDEGPGAVVGRREVAEGVPGLGGAGERDVEGGQEAGVSRGRAGERDVVAPGEQAARGDAAVGFGGQHGDGGGTDTGVEEKGRSS